jgi:hypothetical protein
MPQIAPYDYLADRERLELMLDTKEKRAHFLGRMKGVNDFCFFILMHHGANSWLADRVEEFAKAGYPPAPEYQAEENL